MKAFGQSDENIWKYATTVFQPEDDVLKKIRVEADSRGLPDIHVGAFDGLHLEILMRLLSPKKVVEIGSLGGYSATCILRGMPKDGELYALELAEERCRWVRENTARAGFPGRVETFSGPAIENLKKIEHLAPFDAVFIDADKGNYPNYIKWAADHLRMGGLAIGDNTFAWGHIHESEGLDPSTAKQVQALREFNEYAARSGRFRSTILPTAEGLTLAVKIK